MAPTRIAAVTGANKGIGLAIVRNLALSYPSSAFNNGPLLIYLTARNKSRGEAAVQSLQSDPQLLKAKALAKDGGLSTIEYHGLDISSEQSIDDFAAFLKKEHPDGIDMVINNAGIAMEGFNVNVVRQTLQANYHGTLHSTLTLLPLLRPHGRLVNLASMVGHLNSKYSPAIRDRFASSTSVSAITSLMDDFTTAVEKGAQAERGWPSAAYAVSKSGVIGMTRAVGREEAARWGGRGVLVNACCPGFVNTDMTRGRGPKSVDEGARTPVMLALGDLGGKTGEFWENERVVEW